MDINILLVILMVIIIVILLFNQNNNIEGFTSENLEAIQNLSSMYENGNLKIKDLTVTGNANITGDANITGNANINSSLFTNKGQLNFLTQGNAVYIETDRDIINLTGPRGAGFKKLQSSDLTIDGILHVKGDSNIDGNINFNGDKKVSISGETSQWGYGIIKIENSNNKNSLLLGAQNAGDSIHIVNTNNNGTLQFENSARYLYNNGNNNRTIW